VQTDKGEKPLSFLEIGLDLLGHGLDRLIAGELLAIDEESRCRIDPELLGGAVTDRLDASRMQLLDMYGAAGAVRA